MQSYDILMLVAHDPGETDILATGSVSFDTGAHSDLVGEFGRLIVRPDMRGAGLGNLLMAHRIDYIRNRLHVGVVENLTTHPFSQQISELFDFAAIGFVPAKHRFEDRECIAMYARYFGGSLAMRRNHPHVLPEAYGLAHMAAENCGLPCDAIVDEDSVAYPPDDDFELEELTQDGLPTLIRIARGRIRNREIFGPMRLQYGYFKLTAKRASYLIAR